MNTKQVEQNINFKSMRLENAREEAQRKLRIVSISFGLGFVAMAIVGFSQSENPLALFGIWATLFVVEIILLIICIGLASQSRQLSEAYGESVQIQLSAQNIYMSFGRVFHLQCSAWIKSASSGQECIFVDGLSHRKHFEEGYSGDAEVFRNSSDGKAIAIDFMGKVFFGRGPERSLVNLVNWIPPVVAIMLVVALKSLVG